MEPFEYVVALISIILGLGLAQLLSGIADLVANYKNTKFSLAHTLYIAVIFLVFIQDWFYTYQYSKEIDNWTIPTCLALFIFPIFLFLVSRFIFPTGSRAHETDMVGYFDDNWRWMYSLFVITIIISIVQNITISGYTLAGQIPLFIYMSAYFIFIFGNIKNKFYHNIFIVAQLLLWLAFVFVLDKSTLN